MTGKNNREESDFRFLLRLVDQHKALLVFAIACSIVAGLATFVPYVMVAKTILVLFGPATEGPAIATYGVAAVIAIIARFALSGISAICTHKAAYETLYQARKDICGHLGRINLGFFTKTSLGEVKKVLMEDVERLEEFFAHQIPDIVVAAVVPVTAFLYLLTLNVQMALMLLIPVVLTMIAQVVLLKTMKEKMGAFYAVAARMSSAIMQFINGMPVMKSFNMTTGSYRDYAEATKDYNAAWWSVAKIASSVSAVCSVLVESGIAFMLPLGGLLFLRGELALGDYVFFMIMSIVFLSSYNNLMNFAQLYSQVAAGVGRTRQIMAIPTQVWGARTLDTASACEISFEDVTFSYDGGDAAAGREVISELDLMLAPGTITAFVGPSGAGKSTAAQLIPRFWDLSSGCIRINGISLEEFGDGRLMDLVSFVFQDAFMLNDTIYGNIAIGCEAATRDQVITAARAAQIHDFIEGLPNGYETHLGDVGVKLSGGERQRVCIARAILKDAPIIIFDEATSFTDMESERKIQIALGNLLKDKTTVMIAHRLHTIVDADTICVFDEGRVVERGTHAELLLRQGLYARMWDSYGKAV